MDHSMDKVHKTKQASFAEEKFRKPPSFALPVTGHTPASKPRCTFPWEISSKKLYVHHYSLFNDVIVTQQRKIRKIRWLHELSSFWNIQYTHTEGETSRDSRCCSLRITPSLLFIHPRFVRAALRETVVQQQTDDDVETLPDANGMLLSF